MPARQRPKIRNKLKNLENTVKGMAEQFKQLKHELTQLKGTTPNKPSKEKLKDENDKGLKCENCLYRCIKKSKMAKILEKT